MDDAASRFIEQLEKDAETYRKAAEEWQELWNHCRAELVDPTSGTKLTAEEMTREFSQREKETRELISSVRRER